MCFSAGASFGAGIVLSVIGAVTLKKVKEPSQIPFASIPIIFAIQQISEGFVWISLTHPQYAYMREISTYTFLFFAQVLWPFWIPLSILLLAKKDKRKLPEIILFGLGVLVSITLAFCLVIYHAEAEVREYHLAYVHNYPTELSKYIGIVYMLVSALSPFISSIKRMWVLGVVIIISYSITFIFYRHNVISVWCFFASIISFVVWFIMPYINTIRLGKIATSSAFNKVQ